MSKRVDTDPPLLVLLPVHHDHLALGERQLVRVVGHTVVGGFHPLWPLFLENKAEVSHRVASSQTGGPWEETGGLGGYHKVALQHSFRARAQCKEEN